MAKYLLLFRTLASSLSASVLKDGVYKGLPKPDGVSLITVAANKVRSVDVFTSKHDKFSRACWTDYGNFQLVVLTSRKGGEAYTFHCEKGEYKLLSEKGALFIEFARGFSLSAILVRDEFVRGRVK